MSLDENKAIVRRLFEEVYNQNNLAVCDEIQEPDYAAFQHEWMRALRTAFPDLHATIHDLIAEGDRVVAWVTISGTHQGPLEGELISWLTDPLPPTGKRFEADGIFIYPIVNGKLVLNHHGVADWLTFLRQLGALPSPSTAS